MKVTYVKAPFQFEIKDEDIRDITENEVLIKIKACGLCGTDVTTASKNAADWQTFGHEVSGIVEQIGKNVTNVKAGDKVTLESGTFCRVCDHCRNGRVDLCNKGPFYAWGSDPMGFGEYMIAAKEQVVLFDGISFEEAALVEPMGVALDLAYTADIQLNDDVLVIGLGPIGLMAVKFAKLMGARKIYAAQTSTSQKRIELAKQFGADEIIYSDKTNLEDYFKDGGVDRVLITAPPKTIPPAIKATNLGGTIAFLGIEYGDGANITFDANEFHFKKLQLKASYASPALYFPRCIDMIKTGMVDAKALISHTVKLDELKQGIETFVNDKANAVKMIMINE